MAVYRQVPVCAYCGKPIAKGIYKDQSHLPWHQQLIGDTFIRWEYIDHKCKEKCLARRRISRYMNARAAIENILDLKLCDKLKIKIIENPNIC